MTYTVKETCPDCEGAGEFVCADSGKAEPCDTCNGEGEWCPYCGEPASMCVCEDEE